STKRTAVLDQVVRQRLPRASTTRWNFHSRSVYEQKDDLLKCSQTIREDPVMQHVNIDPVFISREVHSQHANKQ
ncbi:hypothetical protein KUCAC02_006193, partial [Chaenocephalus aceratus]